MKPLKHYLVPELRLRKNTNYDLMWLLYRTVGINYSDYEAISSNILCLTLLAGYISFEELTYLLGLPEKTPMSLWQELDYLKKKGLLLTTTITQDSLTRNVYYLSAYGFQMTANKFNDLTISYKRRGKTTTVMHDYSAGMNLFHLILFKHPFLYKREESVGVSAKTGRDTVNTLRIDAVCSFKDTPYVLYIEQDMGNEKTSVLVDKLDKYKEYGLMDIPMEDCLAIGLEVTTRKSGFKPFLPCVIIRRKENQE